MKQERRGGIETRLWEVEGYQVRAGSRNAVVALKQFGPHGTAEPREGKQERRGGIETSIWTRRFANGAARTRNAVVALKLSPSLV